MKIRILVSLALVFVAVMLFFSIPKADIGKPPDNILEENLYPDRLTDSVFRIGAYWDGKVISSYGLLKELNINLWHFPSSVFNGWNEAGVNGEFRESTGENYIQNVLNRIDSGYTYGGLKFVMDRAKINFIALGKRSDYECETDVNSDYWFYAFREHNSAASREYADNSRFGGKNTKARFSSISDGKIPGYVVRGLIANREQLNFRNGLDFKWYIKPFIRIDSAFASDSKNDNIPVCSIEIKNYYGKPVAGKERINLYVRNFKKNNSYSGGYIDEYNFRKSDTDLVLNSGKLLNPDFKPYNNDECAVDFSVYWHGFCDMWLDKIRVENEIAYDLFSNNPENPAFVKYQNWIKWEAQDIAGSRPDKVHYFLIDEPEFASLPVLAYLNKKIDTLSGHASCLVPLFSRDNFKAQLPRYIETNYSVKQLKAFLIDTSAFRMFSFDIYPLYGWDCCSKLPNTFPVSGEYNVSSGFLGKSVPPDEYEDWLNEYFNDTSEFWGGDRFIKTLKYGYALYKNYNLPFSATLQAHMNYAGDGYLREPTNEEISMMTWVAVSYGAKEINYYLFGSYGKLPVPIGEKAEYCRGLAEYNVDNVLVKRVQNAYKQNKWNAVKSVTARLKKYGPLLMSFTNENTYSFVFSNPDERKEMQEITFLSDILTLRPGENQNPCGESIYRDLPAGYIYDCKNKTYIQAGVYKNSEENTFYFMIVNRRCSPYFNDDRVFDFGGKRKVIAYFKKNFSGFSKSGRWNIIDCESGKTVASFGVSNPDNIDLGWFLPGEGKLFRIIPG